MDDYKFSSIFDEKIEKTEKTEIKVDSNTEINEFKDLNLDKKVGKEGEKENKKESVKNFV